VPLYFLCFLHIYFCTACCVPLIHSFTNTILSWLLLLYSKSWSQAVSSDFDLQNWIGNSGSFVYKLSYQFVNNTHSILGDFDWDCIESVDRNNWYPGNIVFQWISVEYLLIYLVFLWFLSLEFYSFSHIDLVHILLDLYLSISVCGCQCKQ
jgi:hypothetical protein